MNIEDLLKYVNRTNKDMNKEKLIKELSKSRYGAIGLILSANNRWDINNPT